MQQIEERRWLTCEVAPQKVPHEYAVTCTAADGKQFSLFAPKDRVDAIRGLLAVEWLRAAGSGRSMVYLPADPFGIPFRAVEVSNSALRNA